MLGEFEYLLITAAAALGDEAYGAPIREEIEATTGRRCSVGALYTTKNRPGAINSVYQILVFQPRPLPASNFPAASTRRWNRP